MVQVDALNPADRFDEPDRSKPKWFQIGGGRHADDPDLKSIPDEVYERLKFAAGMHRRSLNSEAIVCLEAVLAPSGITPGERVARARKLRADLTAAKFRVRDMDALKRETESANILEWCSIV